MKSLSFFVLGICSVGFATPSPIAASLVKEQTAKAFKPFTGKITANKVRMRVKPELDSHIVRQMHKDDLLLVVAEEGEFYVVAPPKEIKAYVFRSYILDETVEANHVNIRLEPHAEAPIIGMLDAGAKVQSQICPINHKWAEIGMPEGVRFYVSKEFLVSAGGADYLVTMEKRKAQAHDLLNSACLMAASECKKSYEDMSIFGVTEQLQSLVRSYSDFPEVIVQAKETLSSLKDTYLQKKIAFLEERTELSPSAKNELIAKHREEKKELSIDTAEQSHPHILPKHFVKKETVSGDRIWETLEESLYLSWTAFHSGKKMDDFYVEQKANAATLCGTLDVYPNPVKDKPGNYILRNAGGPIAYVYSTHVELEKYVGQKVSVNASPRPNNHFAFPAYFVLSIDP